MNHTDHLCNTGLLKVIFFFTCSAVETFFPLLKVSIPPSPYHAIGIVILQATLHAQGTLGGFHYLFLSLLQCWVYHQHEGQSVLGPIPHVGSQMVRLTLIYNTWLKWMRQACQPLDDAPCQTIPF